MTRALTLLLLRAARSLATSAGLALALMGGAGLLVAGCDDGADDETADSADSDATSGGEEEADRGELERPPGSREPDDDGELPEGDLENAAGDAGGADESGGDAEGEDEAQAESPWGRPEAETGRPLPPRRPMRSSARSAYQQGLQAARQGNTSAARQAFERALSSDDNAFKAAYNLGVLADRSGQDRQAIDFYERALRIQPDYERAIEGIARIHIRNGDSGRAVDFVRPLADRWVRNLYVQAVYGDTLVAADRPEEAVRAARRALRRDERFVPAMVVLVKANLRLGRNELAESILDQAIETNDRVGELHYLRGRLHQEQGALAPALASYNRAIELEPGYTEARMALGLQQLASGNYQEALQQFRTAANSAPTVPAVRLALGDALRATKQWQQAKAEFDRVQEMSPQNAEVHFNLGVMYREAGADFPGLSTIEAYQRAVSEFNRYRELMGPRLPREDPSETYLDELGRLIEREQRSIERERARAQREAERAAREAAEAQEGAEAGGEQ